MTKPTCTAVVTDHDWEREIVEHIEGQAITRWTCTRCGFQMRTRPTSTAIILEAIRKAYEAVFKAAM